MIIWYQILIFEYLVPNRTDFRFDTKISNLKNLVPNFQISKTWYRIFKSQKFGTKVSNSRIWYQILKSQKLGTKISNLRIWYQILKSQKFGTKISNLKNLVPNFQINKFGPNFQNQSIQNIQYVIFQNLMV